MGVQNIFNYIKGQVKIRWVVSGNGILSWSEATGNVLVVQKEVLKERSMGTIQEQALLAQYGQKKTHFVDP